MTDYKVDVQDISPVEKKLDIVVPPPVVDQAYEKVVNRLRQRAKIKGFRPGKVPRDMVEKLYGDQIGDEVAFEVINRSYFEAVQQKDLKPIAEPRVESGPAQKGSEYSYSATVDVLAPVELQQYKGLEIKKTKASVSEESISQALDQLRDSKAEMSDVTEAREIRKDDYAVIDLETTEDGKKVSDLSAKGFTVPVGHNMLFAELDEALVGLKVGDEKEVAVTVPAEHTNERMAGRQFTLQVTVNGLKEKVLPELNDEFARGVGEEFDSLDALKKRISEDLESRMKEYSEREVREGAIDALIEKNSFDVPQSLIGKQTDELVQRTVQDYEKRGMDVQQLDTNSIWNELRPAAERRVRSELLLDEIANREKVEVDQAALDKFFEREADRAQTPIDTVRQFYAGMLDRLKDRLRLDEALELVIREAKLNEVDPPKQSAASE